jgi:hypothetical protein
MDTLTHLIYASTSPHEFDKQELLLLLEKARAANAQVGVTGMLLCEAHNFFQVLEGPESAVVPLFDKISTDKRHQGIVQIIREPIAERSFGDWTMSFSDITCEEVRTIDGLNDFFEENSVFSQLDSGRAKKLLTAFQGGRWRRKMVQSSTIAPE